MTNIFAHVNTLNELKHEYRQQALHHHPDCGGSDEAMKKINADYTARFEELKKAHNAAAAQDHSGKTKPTTEAPEEFITIISQLLKLDGITVELCGCWLWISGETKKHREALKSAGCQWAPKKGLWSWHHEEDTRHYYRGSQPMNKIRMKYGSTTFGASGSLALSE